MLTENFCHTSWLFRTHTIQQYSLLFLTQHCDLGNNSVIHAVQRTDPLTIDAEIPSDIPTESLGLMPSITEIPGKMKI